MVHIKFMGLFLPLISLIYFTYFSLTEAAAQPVTEGTAFITGGGSSGEDKQKFGNDDPQDGIDIVSQHFPLQAVTSKVNELEARSTEDEALVCKEPETNSNSGSDSDDNGGFIDWLRRQTIQGKKCAAARSRSKSSPSSSAVARMRRLFRRHHPNPVISKIGKPPNYACGIHLVQSYRSHFIFSYRVFGPHVWNYIEIARGDQSEVRPYPVNIVLMMLPAKQNLTIDIDREAIDGPYEELYFEYGTDRWKLSDKRCKIGEYDLSIKDLSPDERRIDCSFSCIPEN